jgi:endonuclease G
VGNQYACRLTCATLLIAVGTPTDNSISSAWGGYRTTVNALEAATGLDLLSAVSPSVQASIEA